MSRIVRVFRVFFITLLLVSLAENGALAWKLPFSLGDRRFKPKVNASIDEKRSYKLSFLVALPEMSPARSDAVEEFILEKCAKFNILHRNIRIRPSFYSQTDAVALIRQSMKRQSPPDIVFLPAGSFAYFGDLQIPMGRYMSENEMGKFGKGALASVSYGEEIVGWPIGYRSSVWAVRPDLLKSAGLSSDDWMAGKLTLGEIAAALAKTDTEVSWGKPNRYFADSIFCGRKPSDGAAFWNPADIASGFEQLALFEVSDNPLDSFITGASLALAPVNERLQAFLIDNMGSSGQTLRFFPAPAIGKRRIISAKTDCITLFRQKEFRGHDQLRAGAEFIRFFAEDAEDMCRKTLAIPCVKGATAGGVFDAFDGKASSFVCETLKAVDEQSAWDRFVDRTVLPAIQQVLEGKSDGAKLIETLKVRLGNHKAEQTGRKGR